jgi:hypothetical protein
MQGKKSQTSVSLGSDMDGSPYGNEEDMMGDMDDMEYGQEQDMYG